MINVEPHVLRYWEEELAIQIPRNELGHRYYTDKEIQLFENIRDLKEKGFQLKAIRLIISTLNEDAPFGQKESEDEHMTEEELSVNMERSRDEQPNAGEKTDDQKEGLQMESSMMKNTEKPGEVLETDKPMAAQVRESKAVSAADKMKHFKYIMDGIVMEALEKNNGQLEDIMASQVTDVVIQEISRLEERQEKQSERYYKMLDEAIRGRQRSSQEVAAARVPSYGVPKLPKRRKKLFKRKFKY